ncbi:hypothetical protein T492DRAFT_986746, partial [Pavlovales sp. CCMP2436]
LLGVPLIRVGLQDDTAKEGPDDGGEGGQAAGEAEGGEGGEEGEAAAGAGLRLPGQARSNTHHKPSPKQELPPSAASLAPPHFGKQESLGLWTQPGHPEPGQSPGASQGPPGQSPAANQMGASGLEDFFGPATTSVGAPKGMQAGGDIFGLEMLMGSSPPALPVPPPPGGASSLSVSAMASLGLGSAWDPAQQAWLDSLPKLPFLVAERLSLPTAPPVVDGATRASLLELRGM